MRYAAGAVDLAFSGPFAWLPGEPVVGLADRAKLYDPAESWRGETRLLWGGVDAVLRRRPGKTTTDCRTNPVRRLLT